MLIFLINEYIIISSEVILYSFLSDIIDWCIIRLLLSLPDYESRSLFLDIILAQLLHNSYTKSSKFNQSYGKPH